MAVIIKKGMGGALVQGEAAWPGPGLGSTGNSQEKASPFVPHPLNESWVPLISPSQPDQII